MTMEVKCGLLVCPVCESSKLNVQRTSVACLECGEPLWSAASPTTAWSVTADIIVAAPPPRFSPERPYGVTIITDDEPVFAAPRSLIDKPESGEASKTWPIETDDQVEALARECDWDNRKYMTPGDYAIWCERMRKFARLAARSPKE